MTEPITYLFEKYGFIKTNISEIIFGQRYLAIMLKDGSIGVCATLGEEFFVSDKDLTDINPKNYYHRIILNAYFNAKFNNEKIDFKIGDITQAIDFTKKINIVMIGYFKPIVERFNKIGVKTHIFDLRNKEISIPVEFQKEYLKHCDAAIVSATTLFNNTFEAITNYSNGDIYILGPTTIMHDYLLKFNNVKMLFGSMFKKNDLDVLDVIRQNLGTRYFLKLGKKVYSSMGH